MAETTFRLPVAGFEQIQRILSAYLSAAKGNAGTPVKLDDVAKRAVMNKTGVSGNHAFLASLGLIEGGNNKSLTPIGLKAALTTEHPGTPEAYDAWTNVIEQSPDLERVVDAVRIRKGMNEDALLSHIVLMAGVPKTNRNLTGARTIVDILEFAGVLRESDGTFSVAAPPDVVFDEGVSATKVTTSGLEAVSGGRTPVRSFGSGASNVVVNVHVWVNANEANFEELADEIKQFLSRLSET